MTDLFTADVKISNGPLSVPQQLNIYDTETGNQQFELNTHSIIVNLIVYTVHSLKITGTDCSVYIFQITVVSLFLKDSETKINLNLIPLNSIVST